MPTVDPVILELQAKIDKYQRDLAGAQRLTDQRLGAIEARGSAMSRTVSNQMGAAGSAVMRLAAPLASLAAARFFLQIADQSKQLTAQLQLATAQFGSFAQAQEDVRRIAETTRADLASTAALYGNFTRNAAELGITQEQAARATETVAKTFKVSGAGAVEAAQGTRQLVQALQSGVLRGDEFNSMMENAPRLARLLADSLGVPIGSLRAMAEEGQLTSDKLVRAFTDTRFTEKLDEEFRKLPVTFDEAMQQVKNAAVITFGAFDRGGEFSTALANFVSDGANGFSRLEAEAESLGISIRASLEGLGDAFDPLLQGAMEVFGLIGSEARTLADRIRPLLGEIDAISGWIGKQGLGGRLITGGTIKEWWEGAPTRGTTLLRDFDRGYNREAGRLAYNRVLRGDPFRDFPGMRPGQSGGSAPAPRRVTAGGGGRRRAIGGSRAATSPLNPEAFADQEARLNDQILRLKVSEAATADERAMMELKRLAASKTAAQADIQADNRYTEAQKAKLIALLGTVESLAAAKVLADRDAEIARQVSAAREQAARFEIDALRAEARAADTLEQRRAIERRILELQQKEEKARLEALIAANEIADAVGARAALERQQAAERKWLAIDQQGPLAAYAQRLRDTDTKEATEALVVSRLEEVNRGISDALAKQIGVKDPLLKGIMDLFIQQVIMRPIADALSSASASGGGGGGILGGIVSGIGSIFGFGRASGGYVAPGRMYRVNEGAGSGRVEGFVPNGGGKVIPLGEMNRIAAPSGGQGGGMATVRLELSGDIDARIQSVAGPVAVEVVRASAPSIIDASAKETMNRAGRPRL